MAFFVTERSSGLRPTQDKLSELEALVLEHKWWVNKRRLNITDGEVRHYGEKGKPYLVKGVLSNSVKSGRMLELVQEMLPDAGITELCLSRNIECTPHRDKGNYGPSYALFLGTFEGGALCFETGERYEQRGVWQGPFLGSDLTHWNEAIISGTKYSVIAYSRKKLGV